MLGASPSGAPNMADTAPATEFHQTNVQMNDVRVLHQNLSIVLESADPALVSQAWQAIAEARNQTAAVTLEAERAVAHAQRHANDVELNAAALPPPRWHKFRKMQLSQLLFFVSKPPQQLKATAQQP